MKANAPKKLYLLPYGLISYCRYTDEDVEYTSADVFIEKACQCIEHLLSGYIIRNFHFGESYNMDKLIDDFRKAMKG